MCAEMTTLETRDGFPPGSFEGVAVHMIGIGGVGMRGVARMLASLGARVAGSDRTAFEGFGSLVRAGVRVTVGHDAAHVDSDTALVVISAAIPESNPELAAARRRGIRVMKYAELLGVLMEQWSGVAIAGTHGKSTTTAMVVYAMRESGLDPSFVVGATCAQLGDSSAVGSGEHFVVESCEYDRSFLHLRPRHAGILNIEPDHLDCYGDFSAIVAAFSEFAGNVRPDGLVICNAEDRWARQAAQQAEANVETFGFEAGADWRAVRIESDRGRYSFDVAFRDTVLMSVRLRVAGRHNMSNALAAAALACSAGADAERVGRALSGFEGVQRRLTWRGEGGGVTIVDDYAHHPTEIRVTLEAARYQYQPRRTWVVFQPHQTARTRHFLDDFADSFGEVEEVIVPDVFGAREDDGDQESAESQSLVSRILSMGGRARYLPSLAAAAAYVAENVTEGDLVLTMGAGDVWKVADELVERIC